jgi:hypothetical protein
VSLSLELQKERKGGYIDNVCRRRNDSIASTDVEYGVRDSLPGMCRIFCPISFHPADEERLDINTSQEENLSS